VCGGACALVGLCDVALDAAAAGECRVLDVEHDAALEVREPVVDLGAQGGAHVVERREDGRLVRSLTGRVA
jgi:hypothetical protein